MVVIDENDVVLAGHARLAAAKLLNMNMMPTLKVIGLSEAQKRAFVLATTKSREVPVGRARDAPLSSANSVELLPPLNWDLRMTGSSQPK